VQTPRFDPARTYADLQAARDPFLDQLKPAEHLILFSPEAATSLLAAAGFAFVQFVPAIFGHYDMSFVASRVQISEVPEERWRDALRSSRSGRVVEALIDSLESSRSELDRLRRVIGEIESDRAARLAVIHQQQADLERVVGEDAELKREHAALITEFESDRAARLAVIHRKQGDLERLVGECAALRRELADALGVVDKTVREFAEARAEHAALIRRLGFLGPLFRGRRSARDRTSPGDGG
jgi:hypothetical protein